MDQLNLCQQQIWLVLSRIFLSQSRSYWKKKLLIHSFLSPCLRNPPPKLKLSYTQSLDGTFIQILAVPIARSVYVLVLKNMKLNYTKSIKTCRLAFGVVQSSKVSDMYHWKQSSQSIFKNARNVQKVKLIYLGLFRGQFTGQPMTLKRSSARS